MALHEVGSSGSGMIRLGHDDHDAVGLIFPPTLVVKRECGSAELFDHDRDGSCHVRIPAEKRLMKCH